MDSAIPLQQYLHYTPLFGHDEVDALWAECKRQALTYLDTDADPTIEETLDATYAFAKAAHDGQFRKSGEPYIVHPLYVVYYLLQIRPDLVSIQTALLHDIAEDIPDISIDDLRKEFGDEIATLCTALIKVGKVKLTAHIQNLSTEEKQLETLKKTFLAMSEDLRVIFIKIADRTHNIQTLSYHPIKRKRKKIAQETLDIYVAIAQRLGLNTFQILLENGAFRILYPKDFARIYSTITTEYSESDTSYIDDGIEQLRNVVNDESITTHVIAGRLKSPYRIFKKLQKYHTKDLSYIKDIVAFRIVVDSVADCYNTLGTLHKHFTPLLNRIKDYIALPKSNGYQSLHTTVLGMFSFPVEIQIRTHDMDEHANYGVAAHYAYKEGQISGVSDRYSERIHQLQQTVEKYSSLDDKEKLTESLEIELLEKTIFVYTPKGDIIELPAGSTVLDFAFRIHSDLGARFKAAFVNNTIVPIDYTLSTGDYVTIQSYKHKQTAKKSWLNHLHLPSSKSKLTRLLKQQTRDRQLENGKTILNDALAKYDLPQRGDKHDCISHDLSTKERDLLLIHIDARTQSPTKLIRQYYPHITTSQSQQIIKEKQQLSSLASEIPRVILDHNKADIDYTLCPECNPNPDDQIFGLVGRDGIKIHSTTCPGIKKINFNKTIEAHRSDQPSRPYHITLSVGLDRSLSSLLTVLRILKDLSVSIDSVHTRTDTSTTKQISYIGDICIHLLDPHKAHFIVKSLKTQTGIINTVSASFGCHQHHDDASHETGDVEVEEEDV